MDGTVANNDPFDLRSVFHQKIETEKWIFVSFARKRRKEDTHNKFRDLWFWIVKWNWFYILDFLASTEAYSINLNIKFPFLFVQFNNPVAFAQKTKMSGHWKFLSFQKIVDDADMNWWLEESSSDNNNSDWPDLCVYKLVSICPGRWQALDTSVWIGRACQITKTKMTIHSHKSLQWENKQEGIEMLFFILMAVPCWALRKCVRNLPQTAQFPVKKFVTTFTMDFDKFWRNISWAFLSLVEKGLWHRTGRKIISIVRVD